MTDRFLSFVLVVMAVVEAILGFALWMLAAEVWRTGSVPGAAVLAANLAVFVVIGVGWVGLIAGRLP